MSTGIDAEFSSAVGPDGAGTHPRPPSRRRRSAVRGLVAGAALATFVSGLGATASAIPGQTDGDTTNAHVVVLSAIALTNLTPDFTLTGLPGATVANPTAVGFTVTTNNLAGYAVTVQAETAVLTPVTAGNPDSIPIGLLSVRETGAPTYTPLSNNTAVTVHTQGTRSALGGDTLSNDYQVNIPFVNEDEYVATLDYVATTL